MMLGTMFRLSVACCCLLFFSAGAIAVDATTGVAASANREALRLELETMLDTDQKHRRAISAADDESERQRLWAEQLVIDKANQVRLDDMVKQAGWPKKSEWGFKASQAAFLIAQHAPLEVMKRYYPLLQAALAEGELLKGNFALFEDRIRMYEMRPQLYGSQLKRDPQTGKQFFWPIEDEANVDKRRAEMELEPLADYARRFKNVEYVPYAQRVEQSLK
ncbi:MAG: hypothetical protein JNM52_00405 [Betaproteobacteria bacterium]|nr:hypothetical protein [Betaproteobacteria bacterium]